MSGDKREYVPIGQGIRLQIMASELSPIQKAWSPKQLLVRTCCPVPQVTEQGPKLDHSDQQEPASHSILSAASPGQAAGSPKQVRVRVRSPKPQVTEQGPKSDHWDQQSPSSQAIVSTDGPGHWEASPKHSRRRVRTPDPQVTEQDPKSDHWDQSVAVPHEGKLGQGRVSVLRLPSLEQYCPVPVGLGSLQNRLRVSVPDPQVTEQVDQEPH